MNPIVEDILEQATSSDPIIQREAVLQLALLLEKHSIRPDSKNNYEMLLPPEVNSLVLAEKDLDSIVTFLGKLIMSEKMIPDMIWALGKCTTQTSLKYLLKFFDEQCNNMDQSTMWQVLIAIDNFLFIGNYFTNSQVSKLKDDKRFITCLEEIIKRGNSDNKMMAQSLINKIAKKT
jgi:hypothetical protein